MYVHRYYSTHIVSIATVEGHFKCVVVLYKAIRKAMPRRCIAAGCNTSTLVDHSLHEFPQDNSTRAKWAQAINLFQGYQDGPSASLVLYSNEHFDLNACSRGLPLP